MSDKHIEIELYVRIKSETLSRIFQKQQEM